MQKHAMVLSYSQQASAHKPMAGQSEARTGARARPSAVLGLWLMALAASGPLIVRSEARMVRLCIASVDPVKLSSQCVMCNRREFPLTVIDCTGITKMNDLIASPLSVQDATCLIYHCRQQVPEIKPEPYHGSVSAVRPGYPLASATRNYETSLVPSKIYTPFADSSAASRYETLRGPMASGSPWLPLGAGHQARQPSVLPYALVPTSYASPFGTRKIKAALIPLFAK